MLVKFFFKSIMGTKPPYHAIYIMPIGQYIYLSCQSYYNPFAAESGGGKSTQGLPAQCESIVACLTRLPVLEQCWVNISKHLEPVCPEEREGWEKASLFDSISRYCHLMANVQSDIQSKHLQYNPTAPIPRPRLLLQCYEQDDPPPQLVLLGQQSTSLPLKRWQPYQKQEQWGYLITMVGATNVSQQILIPLFNGVRYFYQKFISNQIMSTFRFCQLLLLVSIVGLANSTKCLNNEGKEVYWWVMFITPSSIPGTRYAYYDSTHTEQKLQLHETDPSDPTSALARTLTQINTLKMETIAWNDQKPNSTTSSSAAHSKTVIAINPSMAHGFMIVHSMPRFPAFTNNLVNITIDSSQRVYGQHAFCFTETSNMINKISENLRTIKPYIYQSNFRTNAEFPGISALASESFYYPETNFKYLEFSNVAMKTKVIFKNGNSSKNASIFQDGLNHYLKSPLIAETWGRPLDKDWCGTPEVHSSKQITFSPTVTWPYTKDHSKWVLATDSHTSCFGDMNRQSSQWKRGGAFYCIENNEGLHGALLKTMTYSKCNRGLLRKSLLQQE